MCSSADFVVLETFSILTHKVKKIGGSTYDFEILKYYQGKFNNISVYNEMIYYLFADLILHKAKIQNTIPKRKIIEPPLHILKEGKVTRIPFYSCLIEYLGPHSRVTMNSQREITGEFPSWIYFIDVWLGRLDCNGDTNLLLTNGNKIIPVDFNLICMWRDSEHQWFTDYKIFNFFHFDQIIKNKDYRILKIIKNIKEKEIIKILEFPDRDHKIVPIEIKERYLEGLLYRRDNLYL